MSTIARRINWKKKDYEADYRFLTGKLPGKGVELRLPHQGRDITWLVSARSDTEPGESWLFDRKSHKLVLQYRIREKLPRDAMASMESVRYPSSDGLTIPAYLTLPQGRSTQEHAGDYPAARRTLGRDVWGYNGLVQFLANRGYAVLAPNFRASHRLRQEVPERRQPSVGRQNAGRRHLGRQISDLDAASPIPNGSDHGRFVRRATPRWPASRLRRMSMAPP